MEGAQNWTKIGAYGQWAAALTTLLAVCVALYQAWQAARDRCREETRRTLSLYKALLMEIRENRLLLKDASPGWNYLRLHRNVWEVALSDIWGLPEAVSECLQNAYQLASQINAVVDAHLATAVNDRSIYDPGFKKLTGAATGLFAEADGQLTDFLKKRSVR